MDVFIYGGLAHTTPRKRQALCGMVNADPAIGTVVFGVAPDNTIAGVEAGNLDTAQRT